MGASKRKRMFHLPNRKGYTLVEVFIAFVALISVSLILLNSFGKRTTIMDDVREVERDHTETVKAIAKSIALTGSDDYLKIELDSYLPVTNIDKPESLYLVNTYDQESADVLSKGDKLEVLNRYLIGETLIEVKRNRSTGKASAYSTVRTLSGNEMVSAGTPSLRLVDDKLDKPIGVFYTIPRKLYISKSTEKDFSNIIRAESKSVYGVETYEETF